MPGVFQRRTHGGGLLVKPASLEHEWFDIFTGHLTTVGPMRLLSGQFVMSPGPHCSRRCQSQMDSWRHAPWLTDKIMTILAEQNTPAGQDVAESLAEQLRERFRDVPWVTAMPRTRMMGALA